MRLLETTSAMTLRAVVVFLTALDLVVVGLRLYTRRILRQKIRVDDWFALTAFLFVLALAVYFSIGIADHYVGYPVPDDFTGEEYHPTISGSLQHFYIWFLLFFPTLWFIKCAFILFYRRVLVADNGNYKDWGNLLVLFTFVLVTIWTLAFGFAWAFACTPVRGFWSWPYGDQEGPCVDTWKLHRAISISDFLVDLLILLIPIPIIWRLHLPTARKLAVLIVFFLGAIAVAASIMRMARVLWASSDDGAEADGLLVNTTVLFWSMIEANLGLLAACLPTLRGLVKTRTMESLAKSYRSRTWLRSTEHSSKPMEEQDSLPFAKPSDISGKENMSEFRDKSPHDITLATLDSVITSNTSQPR